MFLRTVDRPTRLCRAYLLHLYRESVAVSRQPDFTEELFMTIDAAFTHFPTLSTNRLLLQQIQPNDAEALFATFSDEEVMQFYGHEPHGSLTDTRQSIEQTQARYARREAIRWGITLKGEDRVIGSCGFHNFDTGFHCAETGYILNRAFWRRGIMTEAVSAILTYGFTELGLHRIEAIIDIANEQSKGLLLKLGFTYEGNLRQRYFFRDRFEDEHYFGLLKHEWHGSV
jgi:[ribosomal protein S5]-alanine N-acetyltransferase